MKGIPKSLQTVKKSSSGAAILLQVITDEEEYEIEGEYEIRSFLSPKGQKIKEKDGTITEGVNISSGKRIPINRVEIDTDNIITLNKNESTLKFNNIGYYKISIILSASIYPTNPNFDSKNDFISFGLRLVDTDEIYIGSSEWRQNKYASQIVAEGILSINNTDNTFEIINLGKKEFYLNSPDIKDINSKSYFVNSLVTINIEYLGRGI